MAYDSTKSRFDFDFSIPHRTGVFLGYDEDGDPCGFDAEAHIVSVAGTGGGKTSALMIPNVLRTEDNVFCIDPTGQVCSAVWEQREAMGQTVKVLDPFGVADIPERLRCTFNPLKAAGMRNSELLAIVKGLVVRSDPKAEHWDGGAETLLMGIMAQLLTQFPEFQTLGEVRNVLLSSRFKEFIEGMEESPEPLARAGAGVMASHHSEAGHFKSSAVTNTAWLDEPHLRSVLSEGDLDLGLLKTGNLDLYVVIPVEELGNYARFLRLFISLALRAVQKTKGERRCLLLLDEFFAVGKLPEVQLAFAAGRNLGMRCWIFVQDMGQLELLYGKSGMRSFFANASLHTFMAIDDAETLEHISKRLGEVTVEDLKLQAHEARHFEPPVDLLRRAASAPVGPTHINLQSRKNPQAAAFGSYMLNSMGNAMYAAEMHDASTARKALEYLEALHRADEDRRKAQYDHTMRHAGKARLAPDEVKRMIAKPSRGGVAQNMIGFASGGYVFKVRPWGWHMDPPENLRVKREAARKEAVKEAEKRVEWLAGQVALAEETGPKLVVLEVKRTLWAAGWAGLGGAILVVIGFLRVVADPSFYALREKPFVPAFQASVVIVALVVLWYAVRGFLSVRKLALAADRLKAELARERQKLADIGAELT